MKGREIISAIMEKSGVTNIMLANRLGVSPQVVWDRVKKENKKRDIPVTMLNDTLRALDYKVVVVPRSVRVSSDWYEIG